MTSSAPAPTQRGAHPVDDERLGTGELEHLGTGLAAQVGESVAGGGRHDDPRAPHRALPGDLVGEVGDGDPVRTAGGQAGLDRGAHVVDVHVDVPQPVAADHDERVAEAVERGAQSAAPARRRPPAGTSPRTPGRPRRGRRRRAVGTGTWWTTPLGTRPVNACSVASSTTTRARPPASTTPALARRSICIGVRARASRAARPARAKAVRPSAPSAAAASAPLAAAAATDRIVPSTGRPTAAYAASDAARNDRATSAAVSSLAEVEAAEAGAHELRHDDAAVALGAEQQSVGVRLDQHGERRRRPERTPRRRRRPRTSGRRWCRCRCREPGRR